MTTATGPGAASPGFPLRALGLAVGVGVLALLVYLPALDGEFLNWDDRLYVVENPAIRQLDGSTVAWAATAFHADNWHPLTWLSHAVDYALYGSRPWGHHLTSVLLHAINSGLLLWVLWRLTRSPVPAAAVAALFALHPLHVESVAWVAERKDVLSTLFWLLTLAAYASYVERGGTRRYLLIVAAFAGGLMAKPMVITLPFVLLLLDYWPLGRLSRRAIVEKLPLMALVLASGVITSAAQRAGGAAMSFAQLDPGARVANAVQSYLRYLAKTFWPAELVHYYPFESGGAYSPAAAVSAGLLLVAITAAVFAVRRRCPYAIVGWFWYVGTLVPVIGLVQVGMQSMADRYTYVPLIGIFIALAWGGWELALRLRGRVAFVVLCAAVVLALSVRTQAQIGIWRDSVRLWSHAASAYPDNGEIHYNLGEGLTAHDRADEGARHYARAVELRPNYIEALNNLGNYHYRRNELERAAELYRRSIEVEPRQAQAYAHLGAVLTREQRLDEAIALYRTALSNDPAHVETLNNLGVALAQQGDVGAAIDTWKRSLMIDPLSVGANMNMGRAHEMQGNLREAVRHYEAVVRAKPNHATARARLQQLRRPG